MNDAPSNGIYIVLGEINLLLANLKKNYNKYNTNSNYVRVNLKSTIICSMAPSLPSVIEKFIQFFQY
jgi:hypothetical protein